MTPQPETKAPAKEYHWVDCPCGNSFTCDCEKGKDHETEICSACDKEEYR